MYEKDEEYLKTDQLKDTYDILIKDHHERKLLRPYSPLNNRQSANDKNDDTQVQSLTGTSRMEKRPSLERKRSDDKK